jgi:NAD(P)-dependent dehydrogenase (short-subunit alcohol dehydrogenase family)
MGDRLKGKIAVVMGAGQTPGETIGNGRASAILYAREGAKSWLSIIGSIPPRILVK